MRTDLDTLPAVDEHSDDSCRRPARFLDMGEDGSLTPPVGPFHRDRRMSRLLTEEAEIEEDLRAGL